MIRISKTDRQLDNLAKKHSQLLKDPPFLIDHLLSQAVQSETGAVKALFTFFQSNIEKVLTARPKELESLKSLLSPLWDAAISQIVSSQPCCPSDAVKRLKKQVRKIFDYEKFVKYDDGRFAYQLATDLNCTVCPYCNRQFVFTLWEATKKTRPQFDHFLDKGDNPFFALSFFNLIPCCSICNSSFKGTATFSLASNLHPLVEGAEEIIRFTVGITSTGYMQGKDFLVKLQKYRADVDPDRYKRAEENIRAFAVVELYNEHKDYVGDILKKAYVYNDRMVEELLRYKGPANRVLFAGKEEVVGFILGNYLSVGDLGKRPLAKLTRDLAQELGLISS